MSRTVSLPQGIALYLGAVIGGGVLLLPGVSASLAGPASMLAWLFDGLLGIPLALTFAALASRFPDAGGVASFTTRAFGGGWGAVIGWFYFFAVVVGMMIVPLSGAYYASVALGLTAWQIALTAEVILFVAVTANYFGLTVSGRLQLVFSGAVALLLLAAAASALPDIPHAKWHPFAPHGYLAVGSTALLIFFAFFGWEAIAHLSAEFRDPRRDVVRATLVAVGLITVLYAGVSVAVVTTGAYGNPVLDRISVAEVLGRKVGFHADAAAATMAICIALATANAFVAAASRLAYALARDGAFPGFLFHLSPRGVPRRSVLLIGLLSGIGILLAQLGSLGAETLLIIPNSLATATYIVGTLAAVRLLRSGMRIAAGISCFFCTIVLMFAGPNLLLPVVVAAAALTYRQMSLRKRRA